MVKPCKFFEAGNNGQPQYLASAASGCPMNSGKETPEANPKYKSWDSHWEPIENGG